MTTSSKKKSTARKKSESPAPEIPTAPEAPETSTAPEILTYGFTRQEVAPIALELFKIYQNAEDAAKRAVDLLRACDRAIETDSVARGVKSILQKVEEARIKASLMTEEEIKACSDPMKKWRLGIDVPFAEMAKIATGERERKDRTKEKFLEYVESIANTMEAVGTAPADQISARFDKLWGQFVKNPNPGIEHDLRHGEMQRISGPFWFN